jgi:peptide/nickel transport system ATP-binding protein
LASTVHGVGRGKRLEAIAGVPPRLDRPPRGCAFAPRCSIAESACREGEIATVMLGAAHMARCRKVHANQALQEAAS